MAVVTSSGDLAPIGGGRQSADAHRFNPLLALQRRPTRIGSSEPTLGGGSPGGRAAGFAIGQAGDALGIPTGVEDLLDMAGFSPSRLLGFGGGGAPAIGPGGMGAGHAVPLAINPLSFLGGPAASAFLMALTGQQISAEDLVGQIGARTARGAQRGTGYSRHHLGTIPADLVRLARHPDTTESHIGAIPGAYQDIVRELQAAQQAMNQGGRDRITLPRSGDIRPEILNRLTSLVSQTTGVPIGGGAERPGGAR